MLKNNWGSVKKQSEEENSVEEKILNEEIVTSSIIKSQDDEIKSDQSETLSTRQPKSGWDTTDNLPQESNVQSETLEQSQMIFVKEDLASSRMFHSLLIQAEQK